MGDFEVTNFKFYNKRNKKTKKCCYFHYCQIIERSRVKECSEELIKELMLLPLVPEDRVNEVVKYITEKYIGENNENSKANKTMINVFNKKFIKRYPIQYWNVSKEEYKTNNICESYHRTMNKYFKHKKLNTEEFIPKLIEYIKYRRERTKKGLDKEFEVNRKSEAKRKELKELMETWLTF